MSDLTPQEKLRVDELNRYLNGPIEAPPPPGMSVILATLARVLQTNFEPQQRLSEMAPLTRQIALAPDDEEQEQTRYANLQELLVQRWAARILELHGIHAAADLTAAPTAARAILPLAQCLDQALQEEKQHITAFTQLLIGLTTRIMEPYAWVHPLQVALRAGSIIEMLAQYTQSYPGDLARQFLELMVQRWQGATQPA